MTKEWASQACDEFLEYVKNVMNRENEVNLTGEVLRALAVIWSDHW